VSAIERTVIEGSDESFTHFYRSEFDRLARLAFVLTSDSSLAEELAQEALTRVQPVFARLESPTAYARTVLLNLLKKHRVGEARRRERELAAARPDHELPEARELLDVVDALPFRQRAVIVLRYYEGMSEAEIASSLRCRPGTVKSLAARALARLRREIES
jgi:RNA polymerase sigma factor (sigma-70 family)